MILLRTKAGFLTPLKSMKNKRHGHWRTIALMQMPRQLSMPVQVLTHLVIESFRILEKLDIIDPSHARDDPPVVMDSFTAESHCVIDVEVTVDVKRMEASLEEVLKGACMAFETASAKAAKDGKPATPTILRAARIGQGIRYYIPACCSLAQNTRRKISK